MIKRKWDHDDKSWIPKEHQHMRDVGIENCRIELIEQRIVDDEEERFQIEQSWINRLKLIIKHKKGICDRRRNKKKQEEMGRRTLRRKKTIQTTICREQSR